MSPQPAQSNLDGPTPTVGAIVVAAGRSHRMGVVDKIFARLMGQPLITYSLRVLNDCPKVHAIVLVMSVDAVEPGRLLVEEHGFHKVTEVCAGGERRQDSVRKGLERLGDTQWTIVHDGARPCVDERLVTTGLVEARRYGAAVAAVPMKDTIKSADSDRLVTGTLDRGALWIVQTPQVFRTELLFRAHRLVSEEVTDDATMVERMGSPVTVFMGSYENIKVTTPEDMTIAEAVLRARAEKETNRVR